MLQGSRFFIAVAGLVFLLVLLFFLTFKKGEKGKVTVLQDVQNQTQVVKTQNDTLSVSNQTITSNATFNATKESLVEGKEKWSSKCVAKRKAKKKGKPQEKLAKNDQVQQVSPKEAVLTKIVCFEARCSFFYREEK